MRDHTPFASRLGRCPSTVDGHFSLLGGVGGGILSRDGRWRGVFGSPRPCRVDRAGLASTICRGALPFTSFLHMCSIFTTPPDLAVFFFVLIVYSCRSLRFLFGRADHACVVGISRCRCHGLTRGKEDESAFPPPLVGRLPVWGGPALVCATTFLVRSHRGREAGFGEWDRDG